MTAPTLIAEHRPSTAALAAFDELDRRLVDVFVEAHAWRGWKLIASRQAPKPQSLGISREIMHAVARYHLDRAEAGPRVAARLPEGEEALMEILCGDATDHAVRCETPSLWLANGPLSPALFALAAVRDRIIQTEGPFALLGAEYLFEQVTLLFAQAALPGSEERDARHDGLRLALKRAAENTARLVRIKELILDLATRHRDAPKALQRGFECLRVVYPLAVWDEAYARVIRSAA
jgi:hypothetical protein